MWPFNKKSEVLNDPYSDYLDTEQFMSEPRFRQLTDDERDVIRRALAAFDGQRLHPQIAHATFSAFAAGGLATYALDLAQGLPDNQELLPLAAAALEHAYSFYSHPVLISHLADVLDAAGRSRAATDARVEAAKAESQWKPKDTDQILLAQLIRF